MVTLAYKYSLTNFETEIGFIRFVRMRFSFICTGLIYSLDFDDIEMIEWSYRIITPRDRVYKYDRSSLQEGFAQLFAYPKIIIYLAIIA